MSIASEITALQNDKTAIANAITAKGGTVASGDGFDDFASDIESIPSGGDPDLAVFDYGNFTEIQVPTNYYFAENTTQKKIKVILPSTYSGTWARFCNATSSLEEVVVETEGAIISTSEPIVYQSYYVKHITLNFDSSHNTSWGNYPFRHAGRDVAGGCRIDGQPIDFSGVPSDATQVGNPLFYQCNINYVRFKPNTLNMTGYAYFLAPEGGMFDEDSLVSLYNSLGETTTGSCKKRRAIDTIMGEDDTSNGYHLFVKDSTGTLTLTDWITNMKGWTLV